MLLEETAEQKALRRELRAYLERLMTQELQNELREWHGGGGPLYFEAMQQLGQDGWLGVGWPTKHGGRGFSPMEEFIFYDEVHRSAFPIPFLTLCTVGPTIAHFGSQAQKDFYLPRILAGKLHFSIGYTEPEAGTDLASLKTEAVCDGEEYIVNGEKIWMSLADHADYIWLAVRTDKDAPKHKGISILITPAQQAGISLTPINHLGTHRAFAVHFDNVRVPIANRVGDENAGWRLITAQLNHERIALMPVGLLARRALEVRNWARQKTNSRGDFLINVSWIQNRLAHIDAHIEALRLFNWRQACEIAQDQLNPADASMIKVFGSTLYLSAYQDLLDILGERGGLTADSASSLLEGRIEQALRSTMLLTFGGGANETQRDIIAYAGLNMPRR